MAPRDIRSALQRGEMRATCRRPPRPPEEWSAFRRSRMEVSILAAWMFLYQRKSYEEIGKSLSREGWMAEGSSKARVGQYVTRGAEFLMERGAFVPVGTGTEPAA